MSDASTQAKALLDIALETYTQEIAPGLPREKRYANAMVANALGIAQRRLNKHDPAHALLGATGVDDIAALARAIRSGEISDSTHKELAESLMTYLEAELAITNPKFLDRRKG